MKYSSPCAALFLVALAGCHDFYLGQVNEMGSCGSEELRSDWKSIRSKVANSSSAARLIRAIACAPESDRPVEHIGAHLDEQVTFVASSTGDEVEEVRVLPRALAKREVFAFLGSPEFRYGLGRREPGELELIAQNEACMEMFVLVHKANRQDWVVSRYESACD
ncbi:hypothetical protein [Aerolutibacter ruishenii]|uniref:hypothetical protein n=1 Tax=Aerolutibacter ruishenii TaxID=686800 RepID=UPI00119FBD8C|nr:hypothetical protein [Lysobacter ruishenii]